MLPPDECRAAIEMAEARAAALGGWQTARHDNVATTDLAIRDVPELLTWFRARLRNTLFPMLAARYPGVIPGPDAIRAHDAFLVGGRADGFFVDSSPPPRSGISCACRLDGCGGAAISPRARRRDSSPPAAAAPRCLPPGLRRNASRCGGAAAKPPAAVAPRRLPRARRRDPSHSQLIASGRGGAATPRGGASPQVKYSADEGAQRACRPHVDESTFSFTIALNDRCDYEGGGLWLERARRDGDEAWGQVVLNADAGGVVAFPGKARHGGAPITSGTRYIITLFCYIDANKSKRAPGYVLDELRDRRGGGTGGDD